MSLKCKPHFTLFITMYMQCCTLYTTIHAVLFTYAVHVRSRACSTVHMLKYECMQCCASSSNTVLYMQCCTHAVQVNGFRLYKYIPCSTRTCSDVHNTHAYSAVQVLAVLCTSTLHAMLYKCSASTCSALRMQYMQRSIQVHAVYLLCYPPVLSVTMR